MNTATYHPSEGRTVRLFALSKNEDGTVNLHNDKKALVVGKCPVSAEPKIGHCVLDPEPPKKEEDPKK